MKRGGAGRTKGGPGAGPMRVIEILVIIAVGGVLLAGLDLSGGVPDEGRLYFLERGVEETGAINLVTAIYLGYRAFDTLGESIVLLLAVSAVAFFSRKKP